MKGHIGIENSHLLKKTHKKTRAGSLAYIKCDFFFFWSNNFVRFALIGLILMGGCCIKGHLKTEYLSKPFETLDLKRGDDKSGVCVHNLHVSLRGQIHSSRSASTTLPHFQQ